jgi:hypothetical protein
MLWQRRTEMFTWFIVCAIFFGFWGLIDPVHGTLGITFAICAVAIAIVQKKPEPKE